MENCILIVDDRKVFRSAIKDIFLDNGYNVLGVSSGEMALERVRHRDINVVIVKPELPGWSGLKTLNKLKAEFEDLRIICVADHLDAETQQQYLDRGAEKIVSKMDFFGKTEDFIQKLLFDKNPCDRN
ncbi:MAG TPA: response regulator [bacterium]|nr:response regulator [bacterium]